MYAEFLVVVCLIPLWNSAYKISLDDKCMSKRVGRKCFYLTTHSTHFIYGYMASDIWLRTILIVRKETRCRHIGYSFRLTARVLLYAPSHRQDITYQGLCYTSRGAIAQWVHPMKDRSDDPSHHERTLLPRRSKRVNYGLEVAGFLLHYLYNISII